MTTAADINDTNIAELARALLGEPNAKTATEWRYGARGSLSIDLRKRTWFDHEVGEGGGILDLVEREKGLTGEARIEWLQRNGFLHEESGTNGAHRPRAKIVERYDYTDEDGTLLFQVCRFDVIVVVVVVVIGRSPDHVAPAQACALDQFVGLEGSSSTFAGVIAAQQAEQLGQSFGDLGT